MNPWRYASFQPEAVAAYWRGKPLEEMTKEDLMEVVMHLSGIM